MKLSQKINMQTCFLGKEKHQSSSYDFKKNYKKYACGLISLKVLSKKSF